MRKLRAHVVVSLDGVAESSDQWAVPYADEELDAGIEALYDQSDSLVLGKNTYELFSQVWPSVGDQTAISSFIHHSQKYVVSKTLDKVDWGPATLVKGDAAVELRKLKEQEGKDLLIDGSPTLVRSLVGAGVIDSISLHICPIIVGNRKRLFEGITLPFQLKLAESATTRAGVIFANYEPIRAARTGRAGPPTRSDKT